MTTFEPTANIYAMSLGETYYIRTNVPIRQMEQMPDSITATLKQPPVRIESCKKLAEGKTKIIYAHPHDPALVIITSKNDITAGDGKKHDIMDGKAKFATQTACNVFRLLKAHGLPVAFREQISDTAFVADNCNMILYEVVVRAEAHGSYLKRNPNVKKEHVFPELITEFFLKTTKKQWKDTSIPKDDPYIIFSDKKIKLFEADLPIEGQKPFLELEEYPLKDTPEKFDEMAKIAQKTFRILQEAWKQQGCRLVDFKVEFGFTSDGKLLLADVIDNDSWRVILGSEYIDKQVYRDGGKLDEVTAKYQLVCDLTSKFTQPAIKEDSKKTPLS